MILTIKTIKVMTLRESIIKKRTELSITQCELAEKSGIPQSRISEFESGKREMNSASIDKILAALDININTYKKSYLITYHNMNLITKTGKRRTEEFFKDLFWKEAPEDWAKFDGDLRVLNHQPFGIRDAAVVVFYSEYWESFLLSKLNKNFDVYKVEPV